TISMPQLNEKQDYYNISQDDITIQRLLDDDENPNCQQVRRRKRKYNEISKPPQNIPSIKQITIKTSEKLTKIDFNQFPKLTGEQRTELLNNMFGTTFNLYKITA
ncbi:hypothetical protein L9F63_019599, partial [Diploptera punctata]